MHCSDHVSQNETFQLLKYLPVGLCLDI